VYAFIYLFQHVEMTLKSGFSVVAPIQRVNARKEVILSAGSFNSPQLLLLSGIGDKAELAKVGIDSVLHLPDVGKNGMYHTYV
jgi:choline dehydrogenase-like flavoprotein